MNFLPHLVNLSRAHIIATRFRTPNRIITSELLSLIPREKKPTKRSITHLVLRTLTLYLPTDHQRKRVMISEMLHRDSERRSSALRIDRLGVLGMEVGQEE